MYDDEFQELNADQLFRFTTERVVKDVCPAVNVYHDDAVIVLFQDGQELMIAADSRQNTGCLSFFKRVKFG